MTAAVIGRRDELERVERLLAEPGPPARALVLDGEAGIGKTTLWRAGVEQARARGRRVLVAQPGQNETALPFGALGDLLGGVEEAELRRLPAPQADALAAALQQGEAGREAARLAVARATLALLRALAESAPLVLAVDDVQWLDPSSASVLEFAARRLEDAPARLLVARRSERHAAPPLGLDRAFPGGGLDQLRVGPLDATALDALIREHLGRQLPRPVLLRLAQVTGGNAFYALEIARAAGDDADALRVPPTLSEALRARVEALPPPARDAVLLVAASYAPRAGPIERAAGGSEGLSQAVAAGVLDVDGVRLRTTHPLLASAVYDASPPWERRQAHRRLAEAAEDPEERALHLARATERADAGIASELDGAAALAAARGGPETAADLAEAAARITPEDEPAERMRRLSDAAEHHIAAGDPGRGRELLEGLIAGLPAGRERAALLWRLADAIGNALSESIRLCEQALQEAGDDDALRCEIHTALGVFTWLAGDLARAIDHCRASVSCAEAAGDELLEAMAIGELCHAEALLGLPWDRAAMERALAIESRVSGFAPSLRPTFQLGVISMITDELETARALFADELERARRAGDEPATFSTLFRLVEVELRAGNYGTAVRMARDVAAGTRQAGIEQEQSVGAMSLGLVLAHLGQLDEAQASLAVAHEIATRSGDRIIELRSASGFGFVELSRGDAAAAVAWLTPARRLLQEVGTGELSISGIVQNEIEALVALGDLDEAERVIAFTDEKGRPAGRAWHRAVAARGRALVSAARGDYAAARAALDEALAAHEQLPQPFERGRTLLAAGTIERRAKHRAAARVALTEALELFDELGAARWAERAAAELARIPGRARGGNELTETERRIASLVAEGRSNKEVAAQLYVSVRTVEANLSKVYAKLGVRSRTELAHRLAGAPAPP